MVCPYNGISFSNEKEYHTIPWMSLKNIVLRERSHAQKATYCASKLLLSRSGGEEGVEREWRVSDNGVRLILKVLNLAWDERVVMGAQPCECMKYQ